MIFVINKIYELSEWQSPSGQWHCSNVQDLANNSGRWWIPCRILKISPEQYVLLLKEKFNVSKIEYIKSCNLLMFSWDNKEDMRRYKNLINRKARETNFKI